MKREGVLKRRLATLTSLGEAVGAMKSLSAHGLRQTRGAVAPARRYREGVEAIVAEAGASLPGRGGPAGLLVIGGELGLCGAYNARVAEAGAAHRAALGPGPTLVVGHRAAALLSRGGVSIDEAWAAPTGVQAIPALLLPLAEALLSRFCAGMSAFDIVSTRFLGVGVTEPSTVRLLPVAAPAAPTAPPHRYTSRDRFAATVLREHLYITLYDLFVDALAAEHSARLMATEAAEGWLKDRADGLRRHLTATRREASTQEVIEIAAGARARQSPWADPQG